MKYAKALENNKKWKNSAGAVGMVNNKRNYYI